MHGSVWEGRQTLRINIPFNPKKNCTHNRKVAAVGAAY